MIVSFRVTQYDAEILRRIALRATYLAGKHHIPYDIQAAFMDFTAVHANGTPLRLDDLLNFDDFDFLHDMVGIRRHLSRETGQLDGCFVPRSAKRDEPLAQKDGGR